MLLVIMCVVFPSVAWSCLSQQNDEVRRMAVERVALSSRLQQTQQKMKRLEEELTRSRSCSATGSLATEFFFGA